KVSKQLIKTLLIISVFLSLLLYYYSDILVTGIVGKAYVSGIIIAKILSIAVLFRLLNFGLCEILTTSNNQSLRIYLEAILLSVNMFLNFFLIQYYGGKGAAIATVTAEAVLLTGCMVTISKKKILACGNSEIL
ncbi:MAG: polysaccharide biosynthesis C-terminal domain-containing protein, partial [Nitrospirota bacterium]